MRKKKQRIPSTFKEIEMPFMTKRFGIYRTITSYKKADEDEENSIPEKYHTVLYFHKKSLHQFLVADAVNAAMCHKSLDRLAFAYIFDKFFLIAMLGWGIGMMTYWFYLIFNNNEVFNVNFHFIIISFNAGFAISTAIFYSFARTSLFNNLAHYILGFKLFLNRLHKV